MRALRILFLAFLCFSLFACSTNKHKKPELRKVFTTKIFDNGIKHFNYSVMRNPGRGNKTAGYSGAKRGPQGYGGNKRALPQNTTAKLLKKLNSGLDAMLAQTGFCRDGYIKLDEHARRGSAYIRGECKEGATEKDRQQFPNLEPL